MTYKKPKKDNTKTEFWRILKKVEKGQDILLTKRKKPRQEPLDKKFYGHTTYKTK